MKWRISGQGYEHLTRFSRFILFKPAASTMQKIYSVGCSIFATEDLFIYIYFLSFEENHQNRISRAGKKFLQRFRSFFVKWLLKYKSLAVQNGLRIEHLCDTIPKAQSWLVLNLSVFMVVYIHFNVHPARITDLVRNVSDEKIYWYGTVTFVYVFAFMNLGCVQSVIQLMNISFITFVLW